MAVEGAGVGPVVGRAPGAVKQPGKIDTDGTTARNAGRMARNRREKPCHRRKAREGGGCVVGAVQGAVPYAGWRRRSRNGWMTPRDDAILIGGLDGFDEFDGRVLVTGTGPSLGVRWSPFCSWRWEMAQLQLNPPPTAIRALIRNELAAGVWLTCRCSAPAGSLQAEGEMAT